MAILSKLRVLQKALGPIKVPIRTSHGRTFPIEPSNFAWRKTMDMIHFYLCIGFGTALPIIIWVNCNYAPAELADIPEGYEPEYWEYDKHPIRRFLAKHVWADPRICYENDLAEFYNRREAVFINLLRKRVENVMKFKNDSASWYYEPIDKAPQRRHVAETQQLFQQAPWEIEKLGHHTEFADPPPDFKGIEEPKRNPFA